MGKIIVIIVLGALAIGAGACGTTSTTTTVKNEVNRKDRIVERLVDDSLTPRDIENLCEGVDAYGYRVALSVFRDGFGPPQFGISARDVMDEVLTRCGAAS